VSTAEDRQAHAVAEALEAEWWAPAPSGSTQSVKAFVFRHPVIVGLGLSTFAHVLLGVGVSVLSPSRPPDRLPAVKVKVAEKVIESLPEPPKKAPPTPKPRPKEKVAATRALPQQPNIPPPPPVQGLSQDSFSADGKGISAPAGNTLLVPDEGKRLRPDEVQALRADDLSRDAILIRSKMETPKYTEEAIDAGLELSVKVEVFVDAKGQVGDVELAKPVGYGMDQRLIEAARQAKFEPRLDRFGRPLPGWTTITFKLELP